MALSYAHLVFYDGQCGLCDHVVQFLLKADKKRCFAFAPLQGTTAGKFLQTLPPELRFVDSLILVEDYRTPHPRVYLLGKGALRIAWLLGWPWTLVGWLSFLPAFLFDWAYRLVAFYRHRIFPKTECPFPPADHKERFLP